MNPRPQDCEPNVLPQCQSYHYLFCFLTISSTFFFVFVSKIAQNVIISISVRKNLPCYKHTSLFWCSVGDGGKNVLARIDTWKSDVFDVVSAVAPDCSNYGMLGYADIRNLVQLKKKEKEIIQVIV